MGVDIEMLYCPACARDSLAEAPPCLDGHEDCPDRACVECGTALMLDVGLVELISPHPRPARHSALRYNSIRYSSIRYRSLG